MSNKTISISAPLNFDKTAPAIVQLSSPFGSNWPAVYIINSNQEAYIGETTDASTRLSQHLENPDRKRLHTVRLISGQSFNKSVALDLESFLISHMAADNKFRLQNGNAGQQKHNYYQRAAYESHFEEVWQDLKSRRLVSKNLQEIENSNLFKYSPYKSLTQDQYSAIASIVQSLAKNFQQGSTFLVNGGPGTGKTILGIYLLKLLNSDIDEDISDNDDLIKNLRQLHRQAPRLKIGMVISMSNLRNIVQEVFSTVDGLNASMVYSPSQVAHSQTTFDLLIVDEAHRLRRRKNLAQYSSHDKANRALGLGDEGTELDWILRKSKHCILLYDQDQSIRTSDVDKDRFKKLIEQANCKHYYLTSQVRCGLGGQEYIDYIKAIFSNPVGQVAPQSFPDYDLRLFDDVGEMVRAIKAKETEYGLCRTVAGYAWKWQTKNLLQPAPSSAAETQAYINQGLYDIDIDGNRFIWNVKYDGWISSPNSVNEIGCIHTIQGFDLNYAGVIIGNDLKYNPQTNLFYVDSDEYYDRWGKIQTSSADLLQYILNIYQVLCTRGMRGTYIYACNPALREYLRRIIAPHNPHQK